MIMNRQAFLVLLSSMSAGTRCLIVVGGIRWLASKLTSKLHAPAATLYAGIKLLAENYSQNGVNGAGRPVLLADTK